MPRDVFLVATPERGEPFVVRNVPRGGTAILEGNDAIHVKYWPESSVQPGKSVALEIEPDGTFGVPMWFEDVRLHRPGSYRLEVFLGYNVATDVPFESLQHALVRSAPASLQIEEPTGDDAAVWVALEASLESAAVRNKAAEWLRDLDE